MLRTLLESILETLKTNAPSLSVVRRLQASVEEFMKSNEVDASLAVSLAPLVQALDRIVIQITRKEPVSWSEVTPIVQELLGPTQIKGQVTYTIEDLDLLWSFINEAEDHLRLMDELLLKLEKEQRSELFDDIFRPVHTIKGVSSFLNLPHIQTLAHALETTLDTFRKTGTCPSENCFQLLLESKDLLADMIRDLAEAASRLPTRQGRADVTVPHRDLNTLLKLLYGQRASRESAPPPPFSAPRSASPSPITPEILGRFRSELAESLDLIEKTLLQLESTSDRLPLYQEVFRQVHTIKGNAGFLGLEDIENQAMGMEQYLDEIRNGKRRGQGEEPVAHLLAELDQLRKVAGLEAPTLNRPATTSSPAAAPARETVRKDVRIDTEKLDTLLDLIGELIIAQAMVLSHPRLREGLDHSLQKSLEYLQKITRDLQNISMSLRMIPLEGLFSRMHRLVRDLSKKMNKKVHFQISGQDTEMDRNVIEQILDPLVHLLRNAMDHGIESPQERLAAGKPEEGTIHLSAKYSGNEIVIEVRDDGRGLDRARILDKAREVGLVKDSGERLSDREVWELIFEPGFSTAKEVTEVSGRGVGMDVVKRNIEKLRGRVDVHTVAQQGTTFRLHIPLTLAIMDGIIFHAGGMVLALASPDVQEFQSFDPERLHVTAEGAKFYHLRQLNLPFVDLGEFFRSTRREKVPRAVVLVVQHQSRELALLVDEVVGIQQVVMKYLPESLKKLRAISGCTILGNGDVCLIVDTQQLFQEVLGR